jgi:hypothetical protein
MKVRALLWSSFAFAAIVVMGLLVSPGAAVAKGPHHGGGGGGGGGGFSTTSTYVKNDANLLNGVEYDLTPHSVQPTTGGGSIDLATTQAPSGVGVSWLLGTSAVGAPQWQEEIGCMNTPPGAYSDAVALGRTSDGGYVLAGGTVGCGSGSDCPSLSGIQCGLIARVDGAGGVGWAQVYSASPTSTAFDAIEPTADGGFVAAGSASDSSNEPRALILKLDAFGGIQWERQLGPTGPGWDYFNDVQPTSDGGFVAAGELNDGSSSSTGLPLVSVLVAKFDANGNLEWQHAFNDVGPGGVTATEHVQAVIQTADGGYAIGGDWTNSTFPGECCQGALLLKLTPEGSIESQTAYTGGVHCFDNQCNTLGGDIYSLHQTADGGYVLAGDANLMLLDNSPLVPFLAKVDGSGTPIWQEQDYQVNPSSGRPLSEYFASSTITAAGPLAIGSTENYSNGLDELFGVQTDANGNVGTCSQIHQSSTLSATDPGLIEFPPGLASTVSVASRSAAPVQTLATTASATAAQC